QIDLASHQAFLAHRRDAADRNCSEVNNEAKIWRLFPLQFFQRGDHRHDFLRNCCGVGPIGKKTIAEIFVNYAAMSFDDLLASKNPRSEENIQVLALHVAAERRKTANVRDEKPASDILDFPQSSFHYRRLIIF